jgi:hypothetical protein
MPFIETDGKLHTPLATLPRLAKTGRCLDGLNTGIDRAALRTLGPIAIDRTHYLRISIEAQALIEWAQRCRSGQTVANA